MYAPQLIGTCLLCLDAEHHISMSIHSACLVQTSVQALQISASLAPVMCLTHEHSDIMFY